MACMFNVYEAKHDVFSMHTKSMAMSGTYQQTDNNTWQIHILVKQEERALLTLSHTTQQPWLQGFLFC